MTQKSVEINQFEKLRFDDEQDDSLSKKTQNETINANRNLNKRTDDGMNKKEK